MFVSAEFSRVQKEFDEDVGGDDQNQTDAQQSRDDAVEEQPAGHTEYKGDSTAQHYIVHRAQTVHWSRQIM